MMKDFQPSKHAEAVQGASRPIISSRETCRPPTEMVMSCSMRSRLRLNSKVQKAVEVMAIRYCRSLRFMTDSAFWLWSSRCFSSVMFWRTNRIRTARPASRWRRTAIRCSQSSFPFRETWHS